MGTSAAWTPERRARQAERIRCWEPWRQSTGPKTAEGKRRSSRNAEAFRANPVGRRAYRLIEEFLRSGDVSVELKQVLSSVGDDYPAPPSELRSRRRRDAGHL